METVQALALVAQFVFGYIAFCGWLDRNEDRHRLFWLRWEKTVEMWYARRLTGEPTTIDYVAFYVIWGSFPTAVVSATLGAILISGYGAYAGVRLLFF